MTDHNVEIARLAYEAYERKDVTALLELVDEDFEWTYLDPAQADPDPQVCHGRNELAAAIEKMARHNLWPQLEEVTGAGDKVMVIVRTPGLDATRARNADDRNFEVLTIRDGRIVAMHACRDRVEALEFVRLA